MGDAQRIAQGLLVHEGYAHVYRVRLDGEGESAADIERMFEAWARELSRGTGIPMHVVQQVTEMTRAARREGEGWRGDWYKGRCVLAPDLKVQGYDARFPLAEGDTSVPAVHVEDDPVPTS